LCRQIITISTKAVNTSIPLLAFQQLNRKLIFSQLQSTFITNFPSIDGDSGEITIRAIHAFAIAAMFWRVLALATSTAFCTGLLHAKALAVLSNASVILASTPHAFVLDALSKSIRPFFETLLHSQQAMPSSIVFGI